MTKILAVGTGPLIEQGVNMLNAHCLRTWNLVKPLADAGHEVALFTVPIYPDRPQENHTAGIEERSYESFAYRAFRNADEAHNLAQLEAFCAAFRPNCLLSIAAPILTRLKYVAPLWADLFGHVIAEGQGKAFVMQANTHLHSYWEQERMMVRRADRVSTCSRRQKYAVYGELGAIGRMNWQNFRSDLVSFIPPAFDPFHATHSSTSGFLRGTVVPQAAFVVLWSGGYNTWTNVDALFAALEAAMAQCPDLHYVSTGGSLYAFDELTYPRFERMVAQSRFRERYHLLGWIEARELSGIYADANLALCIDSQNLETMFGTRTRIVNLLAAGLPVLATRGSEIVEDLEAAECLRVCAPDDAQELAQAIIHANGDRPGLQSLAGRSRAHVLAHYSFEQNTKPLLAWAHSPEFAPDNRDRISRAGATIASPFSVSLSPMEVGQAFQPAHDVPAAKRSSGLAQKLKHLLSPSDAQAHAAIRDLRIDLSHPPEDMGEVLRVGDFDRVTLWPSPETHQDLVQRVREIDALVDTPIRLQSDGLYPGAIEAVACALLDASLRNPLEAAIEVHGLEASHNAAFNDNPWAWWNLSKSFALLRALPQLYPGRFTLVALIVLTHDNAAELEPLCRLLREAFYCRFEFCLPENHEQWPAAGTWREMLDVIASINDAEAKRIRRQLLRKKNL